MRQAEYSVETIRSLERTFAAQALHRPPRLKRYEPGTRLEYDLRGIIPDARAKVCLDIEKFVGGGYAGQVYKVRLVSFEAVEGTAAGLEAGRVYALKILVPPSGAGRRIRDFLYRIGFQAPFSLQTLSAAGRSQALWQKFIRRAAEAEFGRADAVVDIVGTLLDERLGSYGELSEWVDGRMWRFEVDDDLDARRRWKPGRSGRGLGSVEYRAKREFMHRLVAMMHSMGAVELARQYEWWSLKSQPNAMKRLGSDPDPEAGLTAVDFRAGMTLMPFLPQCPADFKLILKGLLRGRLVQFDKGDLKRLRRFVGEHAPAFAGLAKPLAELEREDGRYRDSLVDLTFHHFKLVGSRLRHSIMAGFRESWRVRGLTDERTAGRLARGPVRSFLFLGLGFLPWQWPVPIALALLTGRPAWLFGLAVPVLALLIRALWGKATTRRHIGRMIASPAYFLRAGRGRIAEALIRWLRAGRVSEARALRIAARPWLYYLNLPLAWLPAGVHRILTDRLAFRELLRAMFVQPVRLLVRPEEREKWLLDMLGQGRRNGLLSEAEEVRIAGQVKEPYIQKYLKSLAVHLATLFVSETVFLTTAIVYVLAHPDLGWQQATLRAGLIIGALNLLPISPGSLVRGFYVIGLMIKERNFKDYNIAFGVSFLKIVGYLAFPIQMAYRYPDLARFMAGHWANEAVHRVPVFGEHGAWLEHFVFDAFYNKPLTLRRRIRERAARRAAKPVRRWPILPITAGAVGLLAALGLAYARLTGGIPAFGHIWWAALLVPLFAGVVIAFTGGGITTGRRIVLGMAAGAFTGLLYGLAPYAGLWPAAFGPIPVSVGPVLLPMLRSGVELLLLFGMLGLAGAAFIETRPGRR
jgi:hypothetical protein